MSEHAKFDANSYFCLMIAAAFLKGVNLILIMDHISAVWCAFFISRESRRRFTLFDNKDNSFRAWVRETSLSLLPGLAMFHLKMHASLARLFN